jgi:UDP-N-acetylmuramate dehydrogenase
MKNHTSFKVGGPADILVKPHGIDSVRETLRILKQNGVPFFVMGNGTNLIVRDKGIRGVVVKLTDNLSGYEIDEEYLTAEAGILLSRISRLSLEAGLSGLEFAEGIPGTLGGAVTMNAGAYTGEMSYIVQSTEYLDREGNIVRLDFEQHRFGKRFSFIQADGGTVLRTKLRLKYDSRDEIKARMEEFSRLRREKQPLELPSAGSIFKRPEGYFAGKLIQDCGLKGCKTGGAEVSAKHCGFIVNAGGATAADIISLISNIQSIVKDRFGVELVAEVKIIGEE